MVFIHSDGKVPLGDQYSFFVGNAIELISGFTVEQGGVVTAIIETCLEAIQEDIPVSKK